MDQLEKNAIDSIQLGFDDYFLAREDERRIISSIRNIYAGILLFFKAELQKRSPKNWGDKLIRKCKSLEVCGDDLIIKGEAKNTIGLHDLEERFQLIKVSLNDEICKLKYLASFRNDIEHHFTQKPKESLDSAVLEAFWLLKQFNEKYSRLQIEDLFGKKIWGELIEIEANYKKIKAMCECRWKEINFTNVANQVFPISQEDDVKQFEVIYGFFFDIHCPSCRSSLIEPIDSDLSSKIDIIMKCIKCDKEFKFYDVIEETLEKHYDYEIMIVGSKGGCFPISICAACQLGTFLNYENICIYCGNTTQGEYDPDFESMLFSRNANDYWS